MAEIEYAWNRSGLEWEGKGNTRRFGVAQLVIEWAGRAETRKGFFQTLAAGL